MSNDCLVFKIDQIMINGVAESIDDGSAVITNPTGWENEMVPAALGDHGVKRKRVASTIKYKRQLTGEDVNMKQYESLEKVEVTFRDVEKNRRGRVSNATMLKHGEIGNGDSPEVEIGLSSKIQWL